MLASYIISRERLATTMMKIREMKIYYNLSLSYLLPVALSRPRLAYIFHKNFSNFIISRSLNNIARSLF